MTDRERWIVYPLLFFALGASLRDKMMQQIRTDTVLARRIVCEDVSIIDEEQPDRIVAKLASGQQSVGDRSGILLLVDSGGRELCRVSNDELFVRSISCEGLRVVDPEQTNRVLAGLGSLQVRPSPGGRPERFGVLALNNQEFGRLVGNPPSSPGEDAKPRQSAPAIGSRESGPRPENDQRAGPQTSDATVPNLLVPGE